MQQYSCHTNAMTSWGRAGHGSRKETVHSYTTNTARMQAYANGLSDPKFSTVGAWLASTAEPSELFSVKRMRGSSWSKHAKSVRRLVRLPRVVTPLCKFLPLLCKLERIPRPRRESLQMLSSTALGNEDVQTIFQKALCWNVRSLIFNLQISLGNREIKGTYCSSTPVTQMP